MANLPIPSQRLILAVGLALATFGAPTAVMATTMASVSAPVAACTGGEEEDVYTTSCVPFLVPDSPGGFTTTAANPDIPEIEGVPSPVATAVHVSAWPKNSRTWVHSRYHAQPSAPARSCAGRQV